MKKIHLHSIRSLGFDYLVCRIVYHPNGPAVPYEAAPLRQLVGDAKTIGMPVYAWAYVYPHGVDQQVQAIAGALPDPCENLVLDAEVEWESVAQAVVPGGNLGAQGAALASQLAHGIAEAIGHRAALHLSSFSNPDAHPLPYAAFLAHCESFMPQVYRYLPTSVNKVMTRTLDQCPRLAHQSLGGKLIATVNRPEMLAAVAEPKTSFAGANVWLWDGDSQDMGVFGFTQAWQQAIKAYRKAYGETQPRT